MGEDAGQDYFASLCTMAESLEEELAELMPIRDYCQRCEYFTLKIIKKFQ